MSTAYEQYRAKRLAVPEFRALYEQKRSEIEADRHNPVAHRSAARGTRALKADLARLVGAPRVDPKAAFGSELQSNALHGHEARLSPGDAKLDIKTTVSARKLGPKVRKAARELIAATT